MNNIILFHKLPMLNNTDSAFEMLLRVIASYNDKDLAEFVLSDILDSLQENYMKLLDTDITHEELVQLCDIYFSICLNIANTEEVFRDINFYKEILDELIKNYDPILQTRYTEYCKDLNTDIPITYKALINLVVSKPEEVSDNENIK